jgi:hypothetical protein
MGVRYVAVESAMFLMGEQFEGLPRGPERSHWLGLHIGLGTFLLPLFLARPSMRIVEV